MRTSETGLAEAEARSHLYGLLARLFRAEVDAELLAELRAPTTAAALRQAGVDVEACLGGAADQALLEDLARDYCHLFLLTFPPLESVQRGEGQTWGQHTVQVRNEIEDLGLAFGGGRHLLPDHLATELEVMQHLAGVEAAALAADDPDVAATVQQRQRAFLREHLLRWAPRYLDTVAAHAAQPFYAQVAGLAADFLRAEEE